MVLAVDSSVLLGVIKHQTEYAEWLEYILDLQVGARLVICDVVYAEVGGVYRKEDELQNALARLGLEYDAIRSETAFLAGQIYAQYRQAGGPRANLIPDFLVGAHAITQANGLLAADRGYFRRYFAGIKLLRPPRP
jgi:predicted nucleic acid-binding protein